MLPFQAMTLLAALGASTLGPVGFTIDWFTIDSGGGTSSGGPFAVSGTIGQWDAGPPAGPMVGGGREVSGGFWVGASPQLCPADFNADGDLNADDLADYINCYFALPPCSGVDFNHDGDANADDLADFINAYFAGC